MKRTILAIDDSRAMRFLLQTVLGKDYTVVTAPDGCSAMHWLSNKNLPHLIIADPQLPDMQEWELITEFTSSGVYRDIPLVVLSALDKETTAAKCLASGIADYFMKPFNPLELTDTVHRILNRNAVVK